MVTQGETLDEVTADDRIWVTSHPLKETRPLIERGVVRYVAGIHDFAQTRLNSELALVLHPRAYQYPSREALINWEADQYQKLAPFVRERFPYLQEAKVPYRVVDLSPAFARSRRFPLFFEEDPHRNSDGARLAAEALAHLLIRHRLVPCVD